MNGLVLSIALFAQVQIQVQTSTPPQVRFETVPPLSALRPMMAAPMP